MFCRRAIRRPSPSSEVRGSPGGTGDAGGQGGNSLLSTPCGHLDSACARCRRRHIPGEPLWSWIEASFGIESIGHSGPADWCFVAVYALLVGLVVGYMTWRARRRSVRR
jgi:hypothetical protein